MRYKLLYIICVFIFIAGCSPFKLDKNSNCLNVESACFKTDKTPPAFISSVPPVNSIQSLLPNIDLTFSEELNNPQISDFILTSPGNSLNISSIQKVGTYTYRLTLSGGVQNGTITINYSNVKDYNGNNANGSFSITGNVDIGISFDFNSPATPGYPTNPNFRPGLSSGTGYSSTNIKWFHDYDGDASGLPTPDRNDWVIYVHPAEDGIACTGTVLASGTGLAKGNLTGLNNINTPIPVSGSFVLGANLVVICISNEPKNKTGKGWVEIFRDDTPPTVSGISPPPDAYSTPQSVTFTCEDNYDKIIFLSATQPGAIPPTIASDPTFNADGTINTGTLYTGPIMTPNTSDPMTTTYKWRCIDKGGNLSASVQTAAYTIDSSIPSVMVSLDQSYRQFISGTSGNDSTTLKFTTNQPAGQPYKIKKGGTNCTIGGTDMSSGTIPSTAGGQVIATLIAGSNAVTDFDTEGTFDVRICVMNASNVWGFAYLTITRDDTIPNIVASVNSGSSYSSVQNVALLCTNNADKIAYTVTTLPGNAVIPPTDPVDPSFDAQGNILFGATYSQPYSTPDASTTKLKWQCIDKAGNVSAIGSATYTVDSVLPAVNVVSNSQPYVSATGNLSTNITFNISRPNLPYQIRRNSTNCLDGTLVKDVPVATYAVGQNIIENLTVSGHFTTAGTYDLRICAKNYINNWGYTTLPLQVFRDDTPPNFSAGVTSITSANPGEYTLGWNSATDATSGISGYAICQSTTLGSCQTTFIATYQIGTVNSYMVTGLNPLLTYYFVVRAKDGAGNLESNTIQIKSKPDFKIQVSGFSSPFNIDVNSGSEVINVTGNNLYTITSLTTAGQSYSLSIQTQPTGKICSFYENQYGNLTTDLTLRLNCASGNMAGGTFQELNPAPLNYMAFRGNVANFFPSGLSNITGMAVLNSNIYYGLTGGSGIRRVSLPSAGTEASVATLSGGVVQGIAADGTNLYVTEWSPGTYSKIWKIDLSVGPPAQATLIAGGNSIGSADGPGTSATFNSAYGLAIGGNFLIITENSGFRIRRMDLETGIVSTLYSHNEPIGDIVVVGNAVFFTAQHQIFTASFNAIDGSIGTPSVFAGNSSAGYIDAQGTLARFNGVHDLASDGRNLFITEYAGNRVRKIKISTSMVTTLTGGGALTTGKGAEVAFSNPIGIATDGRNLFVSDTNRIRKITDDSLIGYWPLAGNFNDYNSDGGSGPVNGISTGTPTTETGRNNENSGSTGFSGSGQYVSFVPTAQHTLTAEYSIAGWIKPNANNANRILDKTTNGSCNGYMVDLLNGKLRFLFCSESGTGEILSGTTIPLGQWTHFTTIFTPLQKKAKIYLNGHLNATFALSGTATPTNGLPVRIATASNTSADFFHGKLADMRLYTRVLSESEVNELAQDAGGVTQAGNSFNTKAIGLLTHYTFPGPSFLESRVNTGPIAGILSVAGGSFTGTTGKDGDSNGAYRANGSTDYLTSATGNGLPIGNQPRTICAWVKPANYPNATIQSIVSYGGSSAGSCTNLMVQDDSGSMRIDFGSCGNTTAEYTGTNYTLPLNTWSHVCGTLALGNTVSIFVNGTSIVSTTGVTTNWATDTTAANLKIGAFTNGGYKFAGAIDDVRIYNNSLSAMQIRQLASQIPDGLVASYDFNGDTSDVSGWGNDLSNSGAIATNDRMGQANSAIATSGSAFLQNTSISLPLPANNEDRTLCAWGKPTANGSGVDTLFAYGTTSVFVGYNNIGTNGQVIGGVFGNPLSTLSNAIHQAVWQHVCLTTLSGNRTLYLNGAVTGTSAIISSTGTGPLQVGRMGTAATYAFTGDIDNVQVYNRALNQIEIKALSGYHPMQASAWNPNPLTSNLKLFLQAESVSHLNNNDLVPTWNDSSGNNLALSEGSPANQPTYVQNGLNGKPAIQFTSGNARLNATCSPTLLNSSFTILGSMNQTSNSGANKVIFILGDIYVYLHGGSSQPLGFFHITQNTLRTNSATDYINLLTGTGSPNMLFGVRHNGTNGTIFKNGTDVTNSTASASAPNCASNLLLGRAVFGDQFNGNIGDLLYFTSDLSANDRNIADCYLSARYNIPLANGSCP